MKYCFCVVFLAIGLAFLVGCGSTSRPVSDLERSKQAVLAALDNWKKNEPASKLKTVSEPVDFSEELRKTFTLVEYTLGDVDSSDPQVLRYTVILKLKDKKGKISDREAVYSVSLKNPIAVARDPYY